MFPNVGFDINEFEILSGYVPEETSGIKLKLKTSPLEPEKKLLVFE